MVDAGQESLVVIWQDDCLPVSQSPVRRSNGAFPTTELILDEKFEYGENGRLKGWTTDGRCLTVNRSVATRLRHLSFTHNYDSANDRPLDTAQSFSCYTTTIQLIDAFIGDVFVEEPNPAIDKIDYVSSDFEYLRMILPLMGDGASQSAVLFDSEYVRIVYYRRNRDPLLRESTPWDSIYGLTFEFKESVSLNKAREDWTLSIINLLMVICGCDIVADNVTYYSKKWGAKFSVFGRDEVERDLRYRPRVDKMLFRYCDLSKELQFVVSSWMERPCTLRGVSNLYAQVKYSELFAEVKFSFAMRMAEASFADPLIAEKFRELGLARIPSGEFDLGTDSLNGMKGLIKKLGRGLGEYPFVRKIRELGERYDSLYRRGRVYIDWGGCAEACREYRNEESHGTILGGKPASDHEKLIALEMMAVLHYELSVLDLFPLPEEQLDRARQELFNRSRWNVSLKDFWSRSEMDYLLPRSPRQCEEGRRMKERDCLPYQTDSLR